MTSEIEIAIDTCLTTITTTVTNAEYVNIYRFICTFLCLMIMICRGALWFIFIKQWQRLWLRNCNHNMNLNVNQFRVIAWIGSCYCITFIFDPNIIGRVYYSRISQMMDVYKSLKQRIGIHVSFLNNLFSFTFIVNDAYTEWFKNGGAEFKM